MRQFHAVNGLGSTIALTDSSGAIQTQYAYEPFGAATPTGATSSNWYQFTGRENDGTGLYYYRARYYSPRFQRFISEDPAGFGGGDANLYGYVREDPTNFTDPGGNTPVYSRPGSGASPTSGRKDKCYTVSCYAKNIAIGVAAGLAFAGASAMAAEAATGMGAAEAEGIPTTLVRVIPKRIPPTMLGRPEAVDVFVTTPEAIEGLDANGIAQRLSIPESPSGYHIIQFPTPDEGLASPIFRPDPSFVGGGKTGGGAPEFVIPNGPIPAGASIHVVQ